MSVPCYLASSVSNYNSSLDPLTASVDVYAHMHTDKHEHLRLYDEETTGDLSRGNSSVQATNPYTTHSLIIDVDTEHP